MACFILICQDVSSHTWLEGLLLIGSRSSHSCEVVCTLSGSVRVCTRALFGRRGTGLESQHHGGWGWLRANPLP